MKQLRKNEFVDMLEMANLLFEDKGNFIQCDIPTMGSITYYPKADKVQINRNNTWEEGGFEFVKNILGNPTKVLPQEGIVTSIKEVKSKEELRDDFAMAALHGWLSNPGTTITEKDELARQCYVMADLMLKQREL